MVFKDQQQFGKLVLSVEDGEEVDDRHISFIIFSQAYIRKVLLEDVPHQKPF